MTPRDVLVSAAVVTAALLVACGGDMHRSALPEGPPPTTIEGAQRDIDRWSSALGVPPPPSPPPAPPRENDAGPARPDVPQPVAPQSTQGHPSEASTASESVNINSECQLDCKAIASMRRAVGVLCGLSGEADTRCVEAKKRLGECEVRVARCGC